MNQFQIETAQNISIRQNTAHLGERLLAYLIDSVVTGVYTILMFLLLYSLDVDMRDLWSIYLLVSLPAFLYYLLFETFMNGRTIGKTIMNIRVVRLDGSPPRFSNYFIRWVLRIIDVVISSGGVAVLFIIIKGNGQRLGDLAAGTTVISEKTNYSLQNTLLRDLPDDYTPTFSQVTIFSDTEMQTIKEVFDRAVAKGDQAVVLKLGDKVKTILNVPSTTLTAVQFIDTVINDYTYFTQNG